MNSVDLNCDMGETIGSAKVGDDEGIMPLISSANIACGFHGGDPGVMRTTMRLAKQYGVAVGAHPSFMDPEYFGRREMELGEAEIEDLVAYQVSAATGIAKLVGLRLTHVKPHGALYNMAARSLAYAGAIARAVKKMDQELVLFGLSGSALILAAEAQGLKTCSEVFADRTYQDDGSLTPRTMPGAIIRDIKKSVEQVLTMVKEGCVQSVSGNQVPIRADTICIHGDTEGSTGYATAIRQGLQAQGINIQSYLHSR